MAYQQRGRLLVPIKTQVIPIGDLGLPIGGVEGLQFPDDLPPFLAVNTIQTPAGARILQGDANGHLLQTLPRPTIVNLIAPRTDTVTFNSGDMVCPSFTVALFTIVVTAISGTAPTSQLQIRTKDTQGLYSTLIGGGSASSLSAVGQSVIAFTAAAANAAGAIGPTFRLSNAIAGTTPSVTWYADMIYK